MKLFTLIAIAFASTQAYAAGITCSNTSPSGDSVSFSLSADNHEGSMKTTFKGETSVRYLMKTYIMNANSPGFYYFEGLAKTPDSPEDAKLFRIKVSGDNQSAKMTLTTVGGSNPESIQFTTCIVK